MYNNKKKLILGLPRTFSAYIIMIERLEQLGFEVIDLSYNEDVFKYKSLWDRFVNLIRKLLLNDKGYKNKLKFKSFGTSVLTKLEQIEGKADYCLLIRADIYPKDIIKKIISKSNKSIAYQWDGIDRFPAIKDLIGLFDRFYVFDRKDSQSDIYSYLQATNFYFSHLYTEEIKTLSNTFFFVGTFTKCRWDDIQKCFKLVLQNSGIPKFILFSKDRKVLNNNTCSGIQFTDISIDYDEMIKLVLQHEILLDFVIHIHSGLSFRIFEAIGYKKKLVTNNVDVKNYDFYHPNNIYILGEDSRTLSDFLCVPYFNINEDILNQYNFDTWINNMLEK